MTERCPVCDRPKASQDDFDEVPEGAGEELCWGLWDFYQCEMKAVDWRARALAAEVDFGATT